jgi:hypothetical protein
MRSDYKCFGLVLVSQWANLLGNTLNFDKIWISLYWSEDKFH